MPDPPPTTAPGPDNPPPSEGGAGTVTDAETRLHWDGVDIGPISAHEHDWDGHQVAATDRLVAVASPLRGGKSGLSAKFTLRQGDKPVGSGTRTELWHGGHNRPTATEGEDAYSAFSVYIPADFRAGSWTIFHQMHGTTGSPPIAFQAEQKSGRDRMIIMKRGGSSSSPKSRTFQVGDIETGQWHDFVYRARWHTDSRGLLQVWHRLPAISDEWQLVVDSDGPLGYSEGGTFKGAYPKLGLYRSSSITWDTVVYHGGIDLEASSFQQATSLFSP